MENFDLKKFLAENKLTDNSKELAEYDMKKTGESEKYEVTVTDANGKKSYQKLSADGMNHYLKMTKFPVTIEFKSKSTTPDFDITNATDDFGRRIKSEAVDNTPIVIDGKEVDENSVELGQEDFGNGEEYFVDKANFVDGTELDLDQMQELTDNYIERFAPDSNKYTGRR